MRFVKVVVKGEPIPQPRQRYRVIVPKGGGKPFATNYTPTTDPVNVWKTAIQWTVQAHKPATLFSGPVLMDVEFYMPRPAYMNTKKFPDGKVYHATRTDVDNLFKAVADALNNVIYGDDGQICDVRVVKYYAEKNGDPRAEILVQELT